MSFNIDCEENSLKNLYQLFLTDTEEDDDAVMRLAWTAMVLGARMYAPETSEEMLDYMLQKVEFLKMEMRNHILDNK